MHLNGFQYNPLGGGGGSGSGLLNFVTFVSLMCYYTDRNVCFCVRPVISLLKYPTAFATVQFYNYCTSCYLAKFIVAYCQLQSLHRSYCIVVTMYAMVQVHRQ